jgi:hypothetical protein
MKFEIMKRNMKLLRYFQWIRKQSEPKPCPDQEPCRIYCSIWFRLEINAESLLLITF